MYISIRNRSIKMVVSSRTVKSVILLVCEPLTSLFSALRHLGSHFCCFTKAFSESFWIQCTYEATQKGRAHISINKRIPVTFLLSPHEFPVILQWCFSCAKLAFLTRFGLSRVSNKSGYWKRTFLLVFENFNHAQLSLTKSI